MQGCVVKHVLHFNFTGCVVNGAIADVIIPEIKIFDKGLIFVKDTDILLSGDKWTIVVNIGLDDYSTLVDSVRSMLSHIRQQVQVHKNPKKYSFDIHWDELDRLDKMNEGLGVDLSSFQQLLVKETSS